MRHSTVLRIRIQSMLKDENGATMVEYSLMVVFIAMAAFASVVIFGMSSANVIFQCPRQVYFPV